MSGPIDNDGDNHGDNHGDNNRDDDDLSLFRSEMEGVKPLKKANRVGHRPEPRPVRVGRHAEADDLSLEDVFSDAIRADEECPEILEFSRSGMQNKVLSQLRAGKLPIEDVVDLHGLSVKEARAYLIDFLQHCEQSDIRNVLIIHGKGFRSKQKPVIKPMVNRWLRETDRVLAFHSAQRKDGGTGAVYVLLKKGG